MYVLDSNLKVAHNMRFGIPMSRKFRSTRFIVAVAAITLVVFQQFVDMNRLAIWYVDNRYGTSTSWGSFSVSLDQNNFVIDKKEKYLAIGYRSTFDELAPINNVLTISSANQKFKTISDGLNAICAQQSCDTFNAKSERVGEYNLDFVEAVTKLKSVGANYHVFMYQADFDMLIAYRGSANEYRHFSKAIESIKLSLSHANLPKLIASSPVGMK